MAFAPVKSYNFGGLRATNSSGPIPQGFNTGIDPYGGLARRPSPQNLISLLGGIDIGGSRDTVPTGSPGPVTPLGGIDIGGSRFTGPTGVAPIDISGSRFPGYGPDATGANPVRVAPIHQSGTRFPGAPSQNLLTLLLGG